MSVLGASGATYITLSTNGGPQVHASRYVSNPAHVLLAAVCLVVAVACLAASSQPKRTSEDAAHTWLLAAAFFGAAAVAWIIL